MRISKHKASRVGPLACSPQDPLKDLIGTMGLTPEQRHLVERICAQWVRVEDILETAAGPREPIGELLVKAGRITRPQLDLALAEQRQGREKLGEILVRKCWLTEPELGALQQQPSLTITSQDIQRGYVDVSAGTSLRTRTNDRNGFLVNFDPRSNVFERVSVTGIGGTVEIGSGGGAVRAAYSGPESVAQLSYRFYLAQGVQSGNYPWPLQISGSVSY